MTRTADIAQIVNRHSEEFAGLADYIWDHPQLRWAEHAAVAAQMEVAERLGFRVTPDVAGIPTAFSAELGSDGPVVAILGEYDALAALSQESEATEPRIDADSGTDAGHGCGHHLLGSGSLLAAVAAANYLEQNGLPGRIRYYGCPAEEAGAGKTFMVQAGAFDDVDAAVTWHPHWSTGVWRMDSLAVCQSHISFTGTSAHAGAAPELGRSALDAAELMNIGVNFLREHMPSDCRVHYAFVDAGGVSPNVVQSTARLYYLVRAPDVPRMRDLYARVLKIAEGAAMMTETEVEIEFDGATSELLPNDELEHALSEVLAENGPVPFTDADRERARPFLRTLTSMEIAEAEQVLKARLGAEAPLHDGIVPYDASLPRLRSGGSTDVADVSWVVPTVQCFSACCAVGTPFHSWQLVAQGKLALAHKGMFHAAKLMAGTAVRLATEPELLEAALAEHRRRTTERPYVRPIPDHVVAPPLRNGVDANEAPLFAAAR